MLSDAAQCTLQDSTLTNFQVSHVDFIGGRCSQAFMMTITIALEVKSY